MFSLYLERYSWREKFVIRKMCTCAQSCPTLWDPVDCSPLGSSTHGIFQALILERVAISSSRGSARPRNQTQVFCTGGIVFTHWATREAKYVNQHNHVSITFIYKSRFWAGFDLWFSLLTSDLKVLLIKKKKYMDVSESDSVISDSLEFSRPEYWSG